MVEAIAVCNVILIWVAAAVILQLETHSKLISHAAFAAMKMRVARIHLTIRRTKSTLYRHSSEWLMGARVFCVVRCG